MSNMCPKCGEPLSRGLKYSFACGTAELTAGGYDWGKECLRRQLAAANEMVGELEREQENLRMAWRRGSDPFLSGPGSVKIGFWRGDYDTIDRILGGD